MTHRYPVLLYLIFLSGAALAQAPDELVSVREIYMTNCADCHGSQGSASEMRADFPTIPDFTKTAWQEDRSDGKIRAGIKIGVGDEMPAFDGEFTDNELDGLVKLIRSFAPDFKTTKKGSDSSQEFSDKFQALVERLRRLRAELEQLQIQFAKLQAQ